MTTTHKLRGLAISVDEGGNVTLIIDGEPVPGVKSVSLQAMDENKSTHINVVIYDYSNETGEAIILLRAFPNVSVFAFYP